MALDRSDSEPDVPLLDRLERIDALDRGGASSAELLPELRGLLDEAERRSMPAPREGTPTEGRWSSAGARR